MTESCSGLKLLLVLEKPYLALAENGRDCRSSQDRLAFAVHAWHLAVGFKLIAVGEAVSRASGVCVCVCVCACGAAEEAQSC